jgi:hypothetical protein
VATIVDRLVWARRRDGRSAVARRRARTSERERPLWQVLAALYAGLVLMIVLFTAAAFLVARLAT